ncbi:MAG: hypothetical protein JWP25_5046 [Bradyrhizobium sp.]|jgi:hypothetical protein|nr:hypothetical protein [Bradyrhizobium sp.]
MDMRDDTKKAIRTLWSWLRGASWPIDREANERRVASTGPTTRLPSGPAPGGAKSEPRVVLQVVGSDQAAPSGILLQFPLRGEALLVKLADLLRMRIANSPASRGPEHDPLLLTMSRCCGSRLSIDRTAYVEFIANRSSYHVAIEAAPDTTVTLDTTDFDTLVKFVVQYVTERLSEPATPEVASWASR